MNIQTILNFILRKKTLSSILNTFDKARSDLGIFSAAQAVALKNLEAKQAAVVKAKEKADKCLTNLNKLVGDE